MSSVALPVEVIDGKEYLRNALDCLVPKEQVREIDLARTELVLEKVAKAKALQKQLRELKYELLADIGAFVEMSAERYEAKLGGRKGNVTLATFDGAFQLTRQISEYIVFDEGLQAAKALIDECFRGWTQDSSSEIRAIIDYAFQVDKEGKINTGRILGLRRLDITDERWQRAMSAISESIQVAGSRAYVRVYERNSYGKYDAVSLDMAAL